MRIGTLTTRILAVLAVTAALAWSQTGPTRAQGRMGGGMMDGHDVGNGMVSGYGVPRALPLLRHDGDGPGHWRLQLVVSERQYRIEETL